MHYRILCSIKWQALLSGENALFKHTHAHMHTYTHTNKQTKKSRHIPSPFSVQNIMEEDGGEYKGPYISTAVHGWSLFSSLLKLSLFV